MKKTKPLIIIIIAIFSLISVFNFHKIFAGSAIETINGKPTPVCLSPYSESCGTNCTRQITCEGKSFRIGDCKCTDPAKPSEPAKPAEPSKPTCPVATIWNGTTCKGTAAGTGDATTDQPPSAGGGDKVATKAAKPNDPKTRQEANTQSLGGSGGGGGRGTTTTTTTTTQPDATTLAICSQPNKNSCEASQGKWCGNVMYQGASIGVNKCFPLTSQAAVNCADGQSPVTILTNIGTVCSGGSSTATTAPVTVDPLNFCASDESACTNAGNKWCEQTIEGIAVDACIPSTAACIPSTAEAFYNTCSTGTLTSSNGSGTPTPQLQCALAPTDTELDRACRSVANGRMLQSSTYSARSVTCTFGNRTTTIGTDCTIVGNEFAFVWPSGTQPIQDVPVQPEAQGTQQPTCNLNCAAFGSEVTGACGAGYTTSMQIAPSANNDVYCVVNKDGALVSSQLMGSCPNGVFTNNGPTVSENDLVNKFCPSNRAQNNQGGNNQIATQCTPETLRTSYLNSVTCSPIDCLDGSSRTVQGTREYDPVSETIICRYGTNILTAGQCNGGTFESVNITADSACAYSKDFTDKKNSPFQLIKKVNAQPVPVTIDPTKLKKGVYIIEVPGYKSAEVQIISDNVKLQLFEDLNGDGVKQTAEKQLDPQIYEIKLQKKEDLTVYTMNAGWNLVGLDFVSSKILKASDLIKEINAQGIEAVQISKYDSGNWIHFVYRKADSVNPTDETFGNDFTLVPGEGYFVRTLDSGTLLLKGNKFASSVPMNLETGWNLISIQALKEYTARTFLGLCTEQGIVCSTLSKYADGLYSSLVIDGGVTYGNDFKILKNEGYFLLVDSEGKTVKP